MEALLQQYWPLLLLATWYAYKWFSARKIRRMLPSLRQQGAVFLDVRTQAEYGATNAPGCFNIPLAELKSRLGELPKDVPLVLCCASGMRSGMASAVLKGNGFSKVYNAGSWGNLL